MARRRADQARSERVPLATDYGLRVSAPGGATPQIPSGIAPDPLTALVVLITELRTEVRQALDQIRAHDTELTELRADQRRTEADLRAELARVDTKVAVLEEQRSGDRQHESDRLSRKAVFWGAVVALASVAAIIVAFIVKTKGG